VLGVIEAGFNSGSIFQFTPPALKSLPMVAVYSLSWMLVALLLVNIIFNPIKSLKYSLVSDLEKLVFDAFEKQYLVQISLKNRKVYIGFIHRTIEPDESSSYLTIIPLLSGHRVGETLRLKITHKYNRIIEVSRNKDFESYTKYRLVIPKSEIISCHRFDGDIHKDVETQLDQAAQTT